MRFFEFKRPLLKEEPNNVFVIGDSIAVGIKNAGHVEGIAVGGSNTTKVLGFVQQFVQSGKAKGATVILSSGAANSSKVSTEDGKVIQQENFAPIATEIQLLKKAGASVALVGVASQKTPLQKPTQYTNGQQWTVDYTGVNQQLESIASANGAKFLGPLEQYDNTISQHDGIHPYNGYSKLFQAGASVAPETASPDPKTNNKAVSFSVDVPDGRRGPAVADVQKALIALGYSVGPMGVDGIRGPYTSGAVEKFQKDNGLTVDGDPGPETVQALNKIIASKPNVFANLAKSTNADVKSHDYSQGADKYAELANDKNMDAARRSADKFLGRQMDDNEWNYLVRATAAEASGDTTEQGYVMGVILNRTRSGNWGNNVVSVLRAPNQFQAVTGTSANGHAPSSMFTQGPTGGRLGSILNAAINVLPSVPTNLTKFTAANPSAYGPGTNINYMYQLARTGQKIGQTYFA